MGKSLWCVSFFVGYICRCLFLSGRFTQVLLFAYFFFEICKVYLQYAVVNLWVVTQSGIASG